MLEAHTNSDWAQRSDDTAAVPVVPSRRHHVSAVLVSHNGQRWLPATLRGLNAQSRPVDAVVAVDTGSTDDSVSTLVEAFGESSVVTAPVDTSFGIAVSRAAARVHETVERSDVDSSWIWLIHDDGAPAPDALERLLALADTRPDAGIIGPKVVGWHDHTLLMEIGISSTGGGRRETFLERHEHDQGQHDDVKDVLAVGSAGMLIRHDVWDALGGFDHNLPMFRDDLDFCMRARRVGWSVVFCGDAMVYHAEAGAHGRRELHSVFDRPHMMDRLSAIHVVLIHWPLWLLPVLVLRMFLGTLGRVIAFLLGRDPLAAGDELAGFGLAAAKISRVVESRAALKRIATVPRATALRPYLPTAADAWRHAMDVVGEVVDLATEGQQFTAGAGVRHTPTAPLRQVEGEEVEQALIDVPDQGRSNVVVRWLKRPSVSAAVFLFIGALVGERALFGTGILQGGALLPVPERAAALWTHYLSEWHDVGFGSSLQSPPYLAVLAILSTIFGGAASLTITVLLAFGVPFAAISAMWALRPWVSSPIVRAAAGVVYGLLPALVGASLTGRVGTVVLGIALPWLVRTWLTIFAADMQPTWRRIWATTLLMAIVTAFVPAVWLITAAVCAVMYRRTRERLTGVLIPLIGSLLLLTPWSLRFVTDPRIWLNEAGRSTPSILDSNTSALDVVLLNPGGPGTSYLSTALVMAAIMALGRRATSVQVQALWKFAVIPFGFAILQIQVPGTWAGPATLVAGAAMVTATAIASDGLLPRLSRLSFAWRQVVVGALLVGIASSSLLAWFGWLRGAGVVSREANTAVPAFVQAELNSSDQPRALVLRRDVDGAIRFELVTGAGPVLGDGDVVPRDLAPEITSAVSDLAAGRGGQEMRLLSALGVRYVVLPDVDQELERRLDTAAGLRRLAGDSSGALWVSTYPSSRLRLVPSPEREGLAIDVSQPLPPVTGTDPMLLFAQPDDGRWVATLDGEVLPKVDSSLFATQWQLPGIFAGRSLSVVRDGGGHAVGIVVQALLVGFVVLMCLPRRRDEDPEGESERDFLVGAP